MEEKNRSTFGTKFGAVMALAGSAVGLGNIWKFPYICGIHGGGAFLIVYMIFVVFIGFSVMLTEFILGRRGQKNALGVFKVLAPGTKWHYFAALTILGTLVILSFYGTIAGWTINYINLFITNSFKGDSPEQYVSAFKNFVSDPVEPVLWQVGFAALTGAVIVGGVKKGIERVSKILMPFLFILVLILGIRACTLPGGVNGLKFLFVPDFSKLDGYAVLAALGHAFFSLSIGMGILLTYASYIDKKENLSNMAFQVCVADTMVAVLAGIAIFPAVFSFGMNPTEGPGLIFLTLPQVFGKMSLGALWGTLFFVLITFAALTSAISLMEVLVAFVMEEMHMERKAATAVTVIIVAIIGTFTTLSFGPLSGVKIFGMSIFDFCDYFASNIILPVGGMFVCYFAGWKMKKSDLYDEVSNSGKFKIVFFEVYLFVIRYIAPVCIFFILIKGLGLI